ncbi:proline-, glutamic acid- and leucine-rich protein 1-like [Mercenaria mercenaria]|uniref:proline-, glutamic acid- and leucine-rich protein 1-like n=1 Tax=Mercenaria mercenaria TaxID=6596 RepID=UPI00234E95AA|nr:proline-, glutamic acid- and leucine-rich protein 1-like [Mercenaria mercenaria]
MAAPVGNVCDLLFKTLFQDYSAKQSTSIALKDVLSIFGSNQILSSVEGGGSMQEMASYIHSCLGNSKQRAEGLLLLNTVVKQCTTDVFQQNAGTWIKLLIQILQGHSPVSVYSASCHVLGEIIQFSKSFSDLSREVTTTVIPQLLPLLIAAPAEVTDSAILCINACIRSYPGPVGPFKNKVESLILQQLDKNTNTEVVQRCYALLSQCGPGGSAGIKHTEAWTQQCDRLIGSLQSTLAVLYEGLESEFTLHGKERANLDLSSIEWDQKDRVTALVDRWRTLASCLEFMLSEETYTVMKVPAEDILELVFRCLSVNSTILVQKPTQERCLLASLIPDIHICALGMLKQLILLCRRNLVPHCNSIVSALCQELVWTQTSNHGYSKQYGVLRQKVYGVLTVWMKALDGCSGVLLEETTLVKHLLQDCAPFTDTFQLTAEKSSSKVGDAPSKKKKRKGYQEISQGISTQRKIHPHANSQLVTAALDALYWLITTSGSEMNGKKLQEIVGFIIHTLFLVQQSREPPVPYSCVQCRKGLYTVLQACVLLPHPKSPSPLQCALQLFSSGCLDKCLEVSSYCVEAVRNCEVMIHARTPCLNGPVVCENLIHVGSVLPEALAETGHFSNMLTSSKMNGIDKVQGDNKTENMDTGISVESDSDTRLKRNRNAAGMDCDEGDDSSKQLKTESNEVTENNDDKGNDNDISIGTNIGKDTGIVQEVVIDSESDSDDDVKSIGNEGINIESKKGTCEVEQEKARTVTDSGENEEEMNTEPADVPENLKDKTVVKSVTYDTEGGNKMKSEEQDEVVSSKDDECIDEDALVDDDDTNKSKVEENKAPNHDVTSMLSAFVDADPDSD